MVERYWTSTKDWRFQKDELLIELVKGRPELYDVNSNFYNCRVTKGNLWKEFGLHLNLSAKQCKERWESLRSQHRKNLNKYRTKGGQSMIVRKWRYGDKMSFLLPYMKEGLRTDSLPYDEDNSLSQEGSNAGFENESDDLGDERLEEEDDSPSKTAKRRYNQITPTSDKTYRISGRESTIKYRSQDEAPHIEQFFAVMANSVKRFHAIDQNRVKEKVFKIVHELETNYVRQYPTFYNQNSFHNSFPSPISPCTTPDVQTSSRPIQTHFIKTEENVSLSESEN